MGRFIYLIVFLKLLGYREGKSANVKGINITNVYMDLMGKTLESKNISMKIHLFIRKKL